MEELLALTAALSLDGASISLPLPPLKPSALEVELGLHQDGVSSSPISLKARAAWDAGFEQWQAAQSQPCPLTHDASDLPEPYAKGGGGGGAESEGGGGSGREERTPESILEADKARVESLLKSLPRPPEGVRHSTEEGGEGAGGPPSPWLNPSAQEEEEEEDARIAAALAELLSSGTPVSGKGSSQ